MGQLSNRLLGKGIHRSTYPSVESDLVSLKCTLSCTAAFQATHGWLNANVCKEPLNLHTARKWKEGVIGGSKVQKEGREHSRLVAGAGKEWLQILASRFCLFSRCGEQCT